MRPRPPDEDFSGRYARTDPIGILGNRKFAYINHLFTYADNNPIVNFDPTGLKVVSCVLQGLVVGIKCGKNKGEILDLVRENADRAEKECKWCFKLKTGWCSKLPNQNVDCEKYKKWSYEHCSLARWNSVNDIPKHIQDEIDRLNESCRLAMVALLKSCARDIL